MGQEVEVVCVPVMAGSSGGTASGSYGMPVSEGLLAATDPRATLVISDLACCGSARPKPLLLPGTICKHLRTQWFDLESP